MEELDLPEDPCNTDPDYNFQACVRESLSSQVGCRTKWDRWSHKDIPLCTEMEQFNNYENLYDIIYERSLKTISKLTKCSKPCFYRRYSFLGDAKISVWPSKPRELSVAFWSVSNDTMKEREKLIYPLASLVAEFGGTLGLYLGFSFMVIWDESVKVYTKCFLNRVEC